MVNEKVLIYWIGFDCVSAVAKDGGRHRPPALAIRKHEYLAHLRVDVAITDRCDFEENGGLTVSVRSSSSDEELLAIPFMLVVFGKWFAGDVKRCFEHSGISLGSISKEIMHFGVTC
jgi:hypothetical protein